MIGLDNPIHLAFLLVILLLIFGAKRLPEMGRSLGTGLRSFKDSVSGETSDSAPERPAELGAARNPDEHRSAAEADEAAAADRVERTAA